MKRNVWNLLVVVFPVLIDKGFCDMEFSGTFYEEDHYTDWDNEEIFFAAVELFMEEEDLTMECSSLEGPTCTFVNPKLKPLSTRSWYYVQVELYEREMEREVSSSSPCRFDRFKEHWMDSGGAEFDIMQKKVDTVKECEELCCQHLHCESYTFWKQRMCYLRASTMKPRPNQNSHSAVRVQ